MSPRTLRTIISVALLFVGSIVGTFMFIRLTNNQQNVSVKSRSEYSPFGDIYDFFAPDEFDNQEELYRDRFPDAPVVGEPPTTIEKPKPVPTIREPSKPIVSQSITKPVVSTAFSNGMRVITLTSVNVRSGAGTSFVSYGTQEEEALGKVIGGPITANGYTWWRIDFDINPDGWSV